MNNYRPCANFKVCRSEHTHELPLCPSCYADFGAVLEFEQLGVAADCPRCKKPSLEFARFPRCVHRACLLCFDRIYYGEDHWREEFQKCQKCFKKDRSAC